MSSVDLTVPTISSQLPITFLGTDFAMNSFKRNCPECGRAIPDANVRGVVSRLIEPVATINGSAVCCCGENISFSFRLRASGCMEVPRGDGWLCIDLARPASITQRFISIVKTFMSQWGWL